MKQYLIFIIVLMLTALSARAQEAPTDYNPFVPANLDDPAKLPEVPVVESSYHYYKVAGDANFTAYSTFVWYVENGTLGAYEPASDTWVAFAGTPLGNGEIFELAGKDIDGNPNQSEIWVRWDDGSGGSTGYIAVYERSADNCVFQDQITGYKHEILVPPEVWFLVDLREECSDQTYAVTAQFNEVHTNSFPYVLTYSYPGIDGIIVQTDTLVSESDLDASTTQLTWDLTAVNDLDVTLDENYVITLMELRDAYGSEGKIAPLGAANNQHELINITIFHLPQTGSMGMD